ncbi:MAG TPA: anthranilate phosphoribosyltransferase [Acidimicrobiia bacterium]|nr:anthranilate phosphoribosyltransferase [Acidimicrobiia bacterium]
MTAPTTTLWPDVIGRLLRREDLPPELAEQAMATILAGEATDAQIAGFAVALRAKGETSAELAALARTMLQFAQTVDIPLDGPGGPVVDTCGTGGDRSGTVNISTLAALVAAGAGVRVAKHGNRAASSACGSADVLEAFGVVIDLGPEGVARCVEEAGIGFCFAPKYHPALRFAGPARRELGTPTTFNFLGPLANPAGVRRRVLGVSDPSMAERMAHTLAELGVDRAMVFCGNDGIDELTTTTVSRVWELIDGTVRTSTLDPREYGIPAAELEEIVGGDAAANVAIAERMLGGEPGPVRDVVALNAAAALLVAGAVPDVGAGLEQAIAAIESGKAAAVLETFVLTSKAARSADEA